MEEEEQTPLPSSVKFVRMVTGEDLITEITEIDPDGDEESYYVFHKPLKIIYAPGRSPGVLAVHFMQWVFSHVCQDQTFVVYPHEVLTIGNPNDNLVGYYWNCIEYFATKDKEALIEISEEPPDSHEVSESSSKDSITTFFDKIQKAANKRKLH